MKTFLQVPLLVLCFVSCVAEIICNDSVSVCFGETVTAEQVGREPTTNPSADSKLSLDYYGPWSNTGIQYVQLAQADNQSGSVSDRRTCGITVVVCEKAADRLLFEPGNSDTPTASPSSSSSFATKDSLTPTTDAPTTTYMPTMDTPRPVPVTASPSFFSTTEASVTAPTTPAPTTTYMPTMDTPSPIPATEVPTTAEATYLPTEDTAPPTTTAPVSTPAPTTPSPTTQAPVPITPSPTTLPPVTPEINKPRARCKEIVSVCKGGRLTVNDVDDGSDTDGTEIRLKRNRPYFRNTRARLKLYKNGELMSSCSSKVRVWNFCEGNAELPKIKCKEVVPVCKDVTQISIKDVDDGSDYEDTKFKLNKIGPFSKNTKVRLKVFKDGLKNVCKSKIIVLDCSQ